MTKKPKLRSLCFLGRLKLGDQEGGHAFPYIEIDDKVVEAELEEILLDEAWEGKPVETASKWVVTIAELPE